ncbi:MAG: hypothetical protein JWN87_2028 [Frankiales bacterium]|jgi:hypothetical protein|nr:hypothetical protein [Frankiales bacterium]MCW2585617.1 hypothetical protein [Frankiales bacterium]
MSALFEYAVLQAVPRVERGECVNVGVVLYSQDRDFLDALVHVDETRLRSLDATVDVAAVQESLDAVCRACAGEGPAGQTPLRQRFGWLTAPRSTVVRTGPIHTGKTDDPAAELSRLQQLLVL